VSYLLDVNILLRSANPDDPLHDQATRAVETLLHQGETVYLVPQAMYEFWAVSTRPADRNGLGFSITEATASLARVTLLLTPIADNQDVTNEWLVLVARYGITGHHARSHDTRYVAAMIAHGITHLLTYNVSDFDFYTEVTVVHPDRIVPPGATTP
jgi:predicted nucleic acid-binding protein